MRTGRTKGQKSFVENSVNVDGQTSKEAFPNNSGRNKFTRLRLAFSTAALLLTESFAIVSVRRLDKTGERERFADGQRNLSEFAGRKHFRRAVVYFRQVDGLQSPLLLLRHRIRVHRRKKTQRVCIV